MSPFLSIGLPFPPYVSLSLSLHPLSSPLCLYIQSSSPPLRLLKPIWRFISSVCVNTLVCLERSPVCPGHPSVCLVASRQRPGKLGQQTPHNSLPLAVYTLLLLRGLCSSCNSYHLKHYQNVKRKLLSSNRCWKEYLHKQIVRLPSILTQTDPPRFIAQI